MSTTDAARDAGPDASSLAETLRDAAFVHFLPAADGDCLAAAGLLAGACDTLGVPFQVSVVRTRADRTDREAATDDDMTALPIDRDGASPASAVAYEAAAVLGPAPDPVTALAGAVTVGQDPATAIPAAFERAGIERRPGVATATDDVADGLAHSTLVHAEFSGEPDAARTATDALGLTDPIDPAGHRRVASLLSLAVGGTADAPPEAATAVEAALRPYAIDGPFATLEGYADVLDDLSRAAPGIATALVVRGTARDAALEAWRRTARSVHAAVRTASPDPDAALPVARIDGPVEPTARLLRDYRVDATAVLAIGDGEAGIAATDDAAGRALASAARSIGGAALDRGATGYARFDPDRAADLVAAVEDAR